MALWPRLVNKDLLRAERPDVVWLVEEADSEVLLLFVCYRLLYFLSSLYLFWSVPVEFAFTSMSFSQSKTLTLFSTA